MIARSSGLWAEGVQTCQHYSDLAVLLGAKTSPGLKRKQVRERNTPPKRAFRQRVGAEFVIFVGVSRLGEGRGRLTPAALPARDIGPHDLPDADRAPRCLCAAIAAARTRRGLLGACRLLSARRIDVGWGGARLR